MKCKIIFKQIYELNEENTKKDNRFEGLNEKETKLLFLFHWFCLVPFSA